MYGLYLRRMLRLAVLAAALLVLESGPAAAGHATSEGWSRLLGTGTLEAVDFTDTSNGWIVGSAGTVRHTSNGGASWASQASGTTKTYLGVHFIDATTGYAVGSGQTIVKYKATVPGPTSPDCSIFRDAKPRSRATRRAVHSRPAPIFANSVPRICTSEQDARTCVD